KGVFPTFRLFGYPTPRRRYSVLVGKSTTKDEDYELEFTDRGYWEGRAFVLASFVHERDSTDRFFGFGNDTASEPRRLPERGPLGGESNYTGRNTVAQATPGVWLLPSVNLSYRMRIRRFSVERGQVRNVPFIGTAYPKARARGLFAGSAATASSTSTARSAWPSCVRASGSGSSSASTPSSSSRRSSRRVRCSGG